MRNILKYRFALAFTGGISMCALGQNGLVQAVSPSWVDSSTGHRIIQITPQDNSVGLYFNQNAFTPNGTKMVYLAQDGVYTYSFKSRQTNRVINGRVNNLVVSKVSATLFFTRPNEENLYTLNLDTGLISKKSNLPEGAEISTLNADDTLLAGTYMASGLKQQPYERDEKLSPSANKAHKMEDRLNSHVPMVLFTFDLNSGDVRKVVESTDWLNHVQFSPTDPHLIMYCHEGLWYRVDRIWTVRTDGTENRLAHKRTMNTEIAGHEFWDPEGSTVWYDLQIPRGQNFYLANYNLRTGARKWYSVNRDAWSIHYNISPDGKLFAGDGGDYSQVAKSKNGQWIELLSPREVPAVPDVDQSGLVQAGFFVPEHLVNLSKQNYLLEPNVRFSPDGKWVLFNGNFFGPSYVYAVEVQKAGSAPVSGAGY